MSLELRSILFKESSARVLFGVISQTSPRDHGDTYSFLTVEAFPNSSAHIDVEPHVFPVPLAVAKIVQDKKDMN